MDGWVWPVILIAGFVLLVWLAQKGPALEAAANVQRESRMKQALDDTSRGWTAPIIVRVYEGKSATDTFQEEAQILADHGYRPSTQGAEGSHLHAGRLILTGGLSVLAGRSGIRSKGKLTVTFEKR